MTMAQRRTAFLPRARALALPLVGLTLLALALCAVYGTQGALLRDDGMYLYAGQRLQEGIPPYVSIFTHKGPLSPLLAGLGVALGRWVGVSDLFATRLVFLSIGCLLPASLFLLAQAVTGSKRSGWWAALGVFCFSPYWLRATAGPEPKLPMLPLQVLSLWCMATRRWFWAGLLGGLASLVWQPMLVFPLAAILLAWLQGERRWRAAGWALAGLAAPLAATVAYFAAKGALFELYDSMFLFNVKYLQYDSAAADLPIWKPLELIVREYGPVFLAVVLGLGVLLWMAAWRIGEQGGIRPMLRRDPLLPVLLTLPAPLIWSVVDFQWVADFFVFIPYLALGFGMLLELAQHGAIDLGPAGHNRMLAGVLALALLGGSGLIAYVQRDNGLTGQLVAVQQIFERFGREVRVLALRRADALALMDKVQPTVYTNFGRGTEQHIEDFEPGGFAGWFGRLKAYDPEIVVFEGTAGEYAARVQAWLKKDYRREKIGPWTVYVRKDLPPAPTPAATEVEK